MIRLVLASAFTLSGAVAATPSNAAIYRYTSDPIVGTIHGIGGINLGFTPQGYEPLGDYAEGSRAVLEIRFDGELPRGEWLFDVQHMARSWDFFFTDGTKKLVAGYVPYARGTSPVGSFSADLLLDDHGSVVEWFLIAGWGRVGSCLDAGGIFSTDSSTTFCDHWEYIAIGSNGNTALFAETASLTGFGPGSWAVIPVPASLPLLGAATLAFAVFRVRRRKS